MIIYIILLLLFSITGSFALDIEISGKVEDIENNTPLENVKIYDKRNKELSKTNADGEFVLRIDPAYHFPLIFAKQGYENYSILLDSINYTFVSIKLRPKIVHLPEIIVGAEIHNKFDEINSEAYSISPSKIQEKLGNTLAITLKNQVGLAMASMGPAPARPVFRGFSGSKISFLSNGLNVSDMSATSPDHSLTIDPMLVQRVELIRGPKVLMYSSNSFSAAIDALNNSNKLPKHFCLNSGLFSESVNSGYSGFVQAKLPINNFGIFGGISYHKSDDISVPSGLLKNTENEIFNYSIAGLMKFHSIVSNLYFENYNNNYGIPGGFVGGHPNGADIEIHKNSAYSKSIFHFHKPFLDNLIFTINRNYYHHIERESNKSVGAEFVYRDYAVNATLNHNKNNLFENGAFGFGYLNKDFQVGGYVFTPETVLNHFNVFSFEEFSLNDFLIQSSIRTEFASFNPAEKQAMNNKARKRDFQALSFSLSILKEFSTNTSLGINLSKTSRIPTIEELYSDGPHLAAYSYEIGNTNLKTESGYGAEIFSYFRKGDFSLYLTNYYNYYSYYIIPRNTGKINVQQILPIYATTGVEALIYGLEAQLEFSILENIFVNTNLSYTFGELLDSSSPLPLIPPLKSNIEVKYRLKNWTSGLTFEIAAAQNRIDEFEEATEGYFLTNFFLQKLILIGETTLSATFSIDNLFDVEYRNHLSRIKSVYPEPGRNFKLLVKYNL